MPTAVPPCASRSSARQHRFDARDAVFDLRGIAGKFLAERQRRRVLQMGAADLDDAVPAPRLVGERARASSCSAGAACSWTATRGGDVHRGREAVVRRLALVDMIVGVDRRLAAALAGQDLVGAAGDHLVGVHVRLGARAGLPDDQRELAVEVAARDFGRRLLDRLGELRVEPADARVHPRRRLLDEAQRMDDLERHLLARAEREILDRALGLRAPIGVGRDLDRAEAVGFGAGGGAGITVLPSC